MSHIHQNQSLVDMKKHHFFIVIFLFLLMICSCERDFTPYPLEPAIWNSSTPEEQGMNAQVLDSAFMQARQTGFVDGLLVIRNGYLVAEEYYNGHDETTPHNVKSVSKSFVSAITGIALQHGYIDSLEEKVLDYFPEYIYPGMDPRKYDITIRHLLTMRMGIRGEAEDNYGVYWEFYASDNWVKKTIEAPLIDDPGAKMHYNTFQTHLLSAIITKATQKSTLEYATDVLFNPMKIDIDSWERDPQGIYMGGNNMLFTPRELLAFGLLYANGGRHDGRQIVPAEWIELSWRRLGRSPWNGHSYGYGWWTRTLAGYDVHFAWGYGGQYVFVVPELQLVTVVTSSLTNRPPGSRGHNWRVLRLIRDYVIPAVADSR